MRKGLEPCPACGKTVAPAQRKTPHPETAECLVIRTHAAYKARGWVPLGTVNWEKILVSAGVPVEHAPGGTHLEPRLVPTGKETGPKNVVVHDEVTHETAFAPASAIMVISALARLRLPADFRARAVRALWQREDVPEAVDTIRRLGGRVTGFVHRLVVDAEEKNEAAAQAIEREEPPRLASDRD